MAALPISGKMAALALWCWKGHETSRNAVRMASIHMSTLVKRSQRGMHTVTAPTSMSGLSHHIRRFGDVASCEEAVTRNHTTHPASPVRSQ